jgi:hypothetical protein
MRPPDEVKAEIVRQWLVKAEQDFKASETLLSSEKLILEGRRMEDTETSSA